MKHLKSFGLVVASALALLACADSASATIVTSPPGTEYNGVIEAELEGGTESVLKNSLVGETRCKGVIIHWSVESQGSTVTASGKVSSLQFLNCNCPITVLKNGSIEKHTEALSINGAATVTGSGQELTSECLGIHCIWTTSNSDLGRITGRNLFPADGTVVRRGGRSGAFCGSSASWVANLVITTPSSLSID